MIILRTPKGWTGPKEVDGVPIEGTFRAHQVPLANVRENPEHLKLLEAWMKSYQPDKLFDPEGRLVSELASLAPSGEHRMGANPHVNGGRLLTALDLPDFTNYALDVPGPGQVLAEAPRKLGEFLRDIIKTNPRNFRFFCPDETNSNRLNAVFEATDRCSLGEIISIDDHVSPDGRVMEVLSEHCCEGWLEGYLLTGRHGVFSSYEAFAQVVDSMVDAAREVDGTVRGVSMAQTYRFVECFSHHSLSGATITMASPTRRRGSWPTLSRDVARSSAFITRRTRTAC